MKFKRGFSLLELVFVVTIVAMVFVFSTPFTMNFYRTQLISDVQSNLIDALQRARHNAVLQKNDSNFGVHIVAGSYTLFQTPDLTYASHVSNQDEIFPVVNSISFGGPTDIIFSKLTGIPSATGTIAIIYNIIVKGITVDSSGVISKDDNVVLVNGSSQGTAGKSCYAILNNYLGSSDGTYWIDPNLGETSDAFQAYCDMADGGWTRILSLVNNGAKTNNLLNKGITFTRFRAVKASDHSVYQQATFSAQQTANAGLMVLADEANTKIMLNGPGGYGVWTWAYSEPSVCSWSSVTMFGAGFDGTCGSESDLRIGRNTGGTPYLTQRFNVDLFVLDDTD